MKILYLEMKALGELSLVHRPLQEYVGVHSVHQPNIQRGGLIEIQEIHTGLIGNAALEY